MYIFFHIALTCANKYLTHCARKTHTCEYCMYSLSILLILFIRGKIEDVCGKTKYKLDDDLDSFAFAFYFIFACSLFHLMCTVHWIYHYYYRLKKTAHIKVKHT